MDISFLIVSYNTGDVIRACIESIRSSVPPGVKYEIIVIDNNSADNTLKVLADDAPSVKVISNTENLGYGAAHNIGAEFATGNILFLLNSDFLINSFSLDAASNKLQTDPNQIIGFQMVFQDGIPQRCVGVMPGLVDLIMDLTATKPLAVKLSLKIGRDLNFREVRRGFFLAGAGLTMTKEKFLSLAGFDDEFFFYAEDSDLCFRAEKIGLLQSICIGDPCVHFGGHATKKVDANFEFKSQNYVESYLKFCRKNRTKTEYALVKVFLPIKFAFYGLAYFVMSGLSGSMRSKYRFQFASLKKCFS